jgi:multiple antibiotic resistance protein
MLELIQAIPFTYAIIFPVLNPLGSAVIFLSLTRGAQEQEIRKLAFRVAVNTFVLLLVVLLTGSWVLTFFGLTIPIVEVGGGLVVAYIGWSQLNPAAHEDSQSGEKVKSNKDINAMSFFPLTMPLTAGPGCIAVILTLGAHSVATAVLLKQVGVCIGILLAAITVYLSYGYADRIMRTLGPSGSQVILRLSSFILLCIGLQILWKGVHTLMAGG